MRVTPTLLRKYLEDHYSGPIEKSDGTEWVLPSFSNPKKMKTYVNIEKGTAMDFIGGQGYSAFQIIYKLEGFNNAKEAQEWISRFALKHIRDIDLREAISDKPFKKPEPKPVERISLPKGAIPVTENSFLAAQARSYLSNRGLTQEDFKKYHFHVGTEGEYQRRIIIPFIENNEIVWYQARAINPSVTLKYLNPPDVSKSMLVYNIDAIKKMAIITEGPFDAMLVDGQAIMGSAASEWQIAKIMQKNPSGIIVIPDNDDTKVYKGNKINAGYQGALKTIEGFVKAGYPVKKIFIAFIEGGKDLNEIGRSNAIKTVQSAKPISFKTLVQMKEKGATSEFLTKII